MNCLLLTKSKKNLQLLKDFLTGKQLRCDSVDDPFSAIQRAQEIRYDLIVIDAELKTIKVQNVIQLLHGCNPGCRIIVVADSNSKSMETTIRKEKIFYYHLNSFGMQDLTTAVSAALDLNRTIKNVKTANP